MSRSQSPKGIIQDAWKPTQSRCKGHFPGFNFSMRDMLEAMQKAPVIVKPKPTDKTLCIDCQKEPKHRTKSYISARCKKCSSINNKAKYRRDRG